MPPYTIKNVHYLPQQLNLWNEEQIFSLKICWPKAEALILLSYCVCFLFSSAMRLKSMKTYVYPASMLTKTLHMPKNSSLLTPFEYIFSFKNQMVIGYYAFHINIVCFFLGADTRKKLLSVILSNITQSICQQNRPPKSAQHYCHIWSRFFRPKPSLCIHLCRKISHFTKIRRI